MAHGDIAESNFTFDRLAIDDQAHQGLEGSLPHQTPLRLPSPFVCSDTLEKICSEEGVLGDAKNLRCAWVCEGDATINIGHYQSVLDRSQRPVDKARAGHELLMQHAKRARLLLNTAGQYPSRRS